MCDFVYCLNAMKSGVQLHLRYVLCQICDPFECDEERSATLLVAEWEWCDIGFECDEKRSATMESRGIPPSLRSGLNAMKSGVQRYSSSTSSEVEIRLNAMKSGVQCHAPLQRQLTRYGLNAMKSGARLCGDFNFGDVKRCLKAMKSGVVSKKKFKGGSRRY